MRSSRNFIEKVPGWTSDQPGLSKFIIGFLEEG